MLGKGWGGVWGRVGEGVQEGLREGQGGLGCLYFKKTCLKNPFGRPIFIQCGCWAELCSLYEVARSSPVLDKNCAPMGSEILSSTGAVVWKKAPMAFPDSSSVLDKFQSATINVA